MVGADVAMLHGVRVRPRHSAGQDERSGVTTTARSSTSFGSRSQATPGTIGSERATTTELDS